MEISDLRQALEQFHVDCYGWALACCGRDKAEAEDVLQTSYLKILDGRARFDERSAVKTWIFGVIRRTAFEQRRRRLLHWQWWYAQAAQVAASSEPPAHMDIGNAERMDLVTGLSMLATRQREVLQLVFYHGLTIEEAARVMCVSVGTARTHYQRGKAKLRARLGDSR